MIGLVRFCCYNKKKPHHRDLAHEKFAFFSCSRRNMSWGWWAAQVACSGDWPCIINQPPGAMTCNKSPHFICAIYITRELDREGSVHHYFYILRRPNCCFLPWTWRRRTTEIPTNNPAYHPNAEYFMWVKNASRHHHHTSNWGHYRGLATCQDRAYHFMCIIISLGFTTALQSDLVRGINPLFCMRRRVEELAQHQI